MRSMIAIFSGLAMRPVIELSLSSTYTQPCVEVVSFHSIKETAQLDSEISAFMIGGYDTYVTRTKKWKL